MMVDLSLRLRGENFDLEAITAILGVQPSRSVTKGFVSKPGRKPAPFTCWDWSSGNLDSFDAHISHFEKVFENNLENLASLPGVESAWLDFFISVDSSAEFLMSAHSISVLNRIGLPVEFSIYGATEGKDTQ